MPQRMMREWALDLVTSEASAGATSRQTELATLLVYEKLRRQLCAPVGVDGFYALASRALAQAKAEAPRLSPVQVTTEGCLRGFDELEAKADAPQDNGVGVVLIAHLLGLFLTFLGAATTRRLVQDVFPLVETPSEPDTTTPFEMISQEVNELRSVSDRLGALANKHPAVEDGLASIAGNIRDIATILDVFVVVKNRPDGLPESEVHEQATRYLM